MKATPFVRVADIEVFPERREAFVSAVTEEMTESVRVEPGVLALDAVADATRARPRAPGRGFEVAALAYLFTRLRVEPS